MASRDRVRSQQTRPHRPVGLSSQQQPDDVVSRQTPPLHSLPLSPQHLIHLQRTLGNQRTIQIVRAKGQPHLQRAYLDVSQGTRLPKESKDLVLGKKVDQLEDIEDDKVLHIFAHSSGDNLAEIKTVQGMEARAFAGWLANRGRAYVRNETNWLKVPSSQIYIHACVSANFAKAVKEALLGINEANNVIRVYGTTGLSATTLDGELVVIPFDLSKEWLLFEEKLGKKKASPDDVDKWKKLYKKFPNGYEAY